MKKQVEPLSDEDLKDYPIKNILPGWSFRVREITPGVFIVDGTDTWGRRVSRAGTESEIESLLKACTEDANQIKMGVTAR